ncbi:hypothetical protein GR925_37830 [Streptomyces sp. HUCO-GS316]|uniref:helix-turn-helix domain-containing protein n=1 Tax=Streptomyces sp. HUCO-GS316 TaxID=2692198 RepID=UPI00136CC625|nr:helix-turn-helix domain-containing protein [Streptomyces sp. HUCO-GS316]MXM69002.1 hypothetical protein [Streptomyces sp. HUCO-GS316]
MKSTSPAVSRTKRNLLPPGARQALAKDLRRKYDAGASIRSLAEETGRSYGFVHRLLSESGSLRGRRPLKNPETDK